MRTTLPASQGLCAALLGILLFASRNAGADYPIASHRYLADPAHLVHDGRLYLYASNDDDNVTNDGYAMASIVCVSTADLKNWTDHGEALRVPRDASWANMSWAPALIERGGTIFMYFGNNANGIGVVSSESPTGPFEDPRGSALVTSSTPGASGTNMWLFDPGVFVDDDGQAYLYFGGNAENNARVVLLNDDMTSLAGSAIQLTIPYFFEASWMHKRDGVYYLSYSTNPDNGMRIDYLTSSSPTSGFTHRGTAGPQPPNNGNNNHAAIFEWNGVWYHAYHNRYVAAQTGDPPGYKRNLALETLAYEADGTIVPVEYTTDGLAQLQPLNPYERVEAETFAAQSGVETQPCSEGGMNLTDLENGDWVRVRGVDFGSTGAARFSARVASSGGGGSIELRAGGATENVAGTCDVTATGGDQTWSTVSCDVSGVSGETDLFLTFTGSFNVDYWEFTPASDPGVGGAGGTPSGGMGGDLGGSAGSGIAGQSSGGVAGIGGASGSAGTSVAGGGAGGLAGAGAGGSSAGTGGAGASGLAGAGATGGVAGANANAGSSGSGAVDGVPPATEASGCGCRTPTRSTHSEWAPLVLVSALAWVRRRRRRRAVEHGQSRDAQPAYASCISVRSPEEKN